MIVDKNTQWIDFAPSEHYINADDVQRIMDSSVLTKYGENGFYMITIKTLLDGMHGEFGDLYDNGGASVFDVYRVRAFSVWIREFIGIAERFTLKPSPKQVKYTAGCVPMTFDESVFCFMRDYFGLPRFDDVLTLTVGDYLLAKKDAFNRMTIERNQIAKL